MRCSNDNVHLRRAPQPAKHAGNDLPTAVASANVCRVLHGSQNRIWHLKAVTLSNTFHQLNDAHTSKPLSTFAGNANLKVETSISQEGQALR